MRRLVVLGAGGFAREILVVVDAINAAAGTPEWDVVGLLADWTDDADQLAAWEAPHLGGMDLAGSLDPAVEYVVAVGDPAARRDLADRFGAGRTAAVLVHPSAEIGRDVQLGPGTIVTSHVSITTHVSLGRHVHVNLNSTIGHDTAVGDYVTLSPGSLVSGRVRIDDGAFLGTGAVLNPRVRVGEGAVVGSGGVVLTDVAAGTTVVGVPARPLRQASSG